LGYACIIDRSNGKSNIKNKIVSQVKLNIPTYQKDKLPKELSSIPQLSPEVETYNEKN
jgi:orotate phosphoribosyltransferase